MNTIEQATDTSAERSVRDVFTELESWAQRLTQHRWPWPQLWDGFDDVDFTPLADLEETDTSWTIDVEVPGIAKEDIEVQTEGRTIVVSGERKEEERSGVLRQHRRVSGTFRYEVTLPGGFDADAIEARLDHGVLTVQVPKQEGAQPRRVAID